ncbi:uncharacterized protein LOC131064379 isoform X2 [Cryptomeria japonica]|uniref:uncharacterized protein LOC131064379 isoform X2 n=1 Tax=Cryptomeria japonica TaxID=3369 RepID=UPI0025ABD903|nr:uncharacterized protein LOC131064379 isoform X2 [Cryptomeria japonica]XP_057854486.1 uncharacterized protein LOC131064379 isoform X2 [Cryptomeria japonica]
MGLKVEDRLDGNLNFTAWKVRIKLALEEEDLLQFIEEKELIVPSDAAELKQFKKDAVKARKILIDSVKDHLVTSIASFTTAREMFSHLQGSHSGVVIRIHNSDHCFGSFSLATLLPRFFSLEQPIWESLQESTLKSMNKAP